MVRRFIRVAGTVLIAGAAGWIAVYITPPIPPKIHTWFLAAGAVLSAISEAYFRSLISELSAVLRRGTYSVIQMEQLQQVIPKARSNALNLWRFSLFLKAFVGLAAAFLQWDSSPPNWQTVAVFSGYCLLIVSFILSASARRELRYVEGICDRIAVEEVTAKEKRRLQADLAGGIPHDFAGDAVLKAYSKPARPV
jgi:hypothetical protein